MEGLHISIAVCGGMQLSEMVSLRRLKFTVMSMNTCVVPSTFFHEKQQGRTKLSSKSVSFNSFSAVKLLFFYYSIRNQQTSSGHLEPQTENQWEMTWIITLWNNKNQIYIKELKWFFKTHQDESQGQYWDMGRSHISAEHHGHTELFLQTTEKNSIVFLSLCFFTFLNFYKIKLNLVKNVQNVVLVTQ